MGLSNTHTPVKKNGWVREGQRTSGGGRKRVEVEAGVQDPLFGEINRAQAWGLSNLEKGQDSVKSEGCACASAVGKGTKLRIGAAGGTR